MTTTRQSISDPEHSAPASGPEQSATGAVLEALSLYATRPGEDEPDYRPMPDLDRCRDAIECIAGDLAEIVAGTRLEGDTPDLLRSLVNLFHFKLQRIERALDVNIQKQKRLQSEQDFSEVKDVELQRAHAEGVTLEEQAGAYEAFRDIAAELFDVETGSVWSPPSGSRVSRNVVTAAIIDSKEFIAARNRRLDHARAFEGPVVLFCGDTTYQDYDEIWTKLDAVHARHPDMVLAYTAWSRGGDLIAAKWANHRGVPLVPFRPDVKRYGRKAAPFKRLDAMIAVNPIGAVATPGASGVTQAFIRKVRERGVPLLMCGGAS